jgi:hypothetical protein
VIEWAPVVRETEAKLKGLWWYRRRKKKRRRRRR